MILHEAHNSKCHQLPIAKQLLPSITIAQNHFVATLIEPFYLVSIYDTYLQ